MPDVLATEEALGVTVTAAIENAPGTPLETFLPVLRNAVTQEHHHVQALKEAGGEQLTTSSWPAEAAFVGFEDLCRPSVAAARVELEELGIGSGVRGDQPGRFHEYPGDPLASGVGTPVSHPTPA